MAGAPSVLLYLLREHSQMGGEFAFLPLCMSGEEC